MCYICDFFSFEITKVWICSSIFWIIIKYLVNWDKSTFFSSIVLRSILVCILDTCSKVHPMNINKYPVQDLAQMGSCSCSIFQRSTKSVFTWQYIQSFDVGLRIEPFSFLLCKYLIILLILLPYDFLGFLLNCAHWCATYTLSDLEFWVWYINISIIVTYYQSSLKLFPSLLTPSGVDDAREGTGLQSSVCL